MQAAGGTVEAAGLVKTFGSITAVDGLSLSIPRGEFFGLLGQNGAGKSTTMLMLTTLLRPSSGSALVNGFDVTSAPLAVPANAGLVFQETTLDRDLTIEENLAFTCSLHGLDKKQSRERIGEILNVLELTQRRRDRVRTLSGGLRRRLDIARGLLHRSQILFLDEPTTGLDPLSRAAVWSFVDGLRKTQGTTIILATHYLDEAERCDRVGIIDRGKLIALGAPSDLKRALGGDVIHLRTVDDAAAAAEIAAHFGVKVETTAVGLSIAVKSGETFVPELFRLLGNAILAVTMHRPSLNDVFLQLTGKGLPAE